MRRPDSPSSELGIDVERALNVPERERRLSALQALADNPDSPFAEIKLTEEVNNHVHTIYSFSPYSPTLAAARARLAGLRAVGSVDHESIAAAPEMLAACRILGIGSTVGCELRVNFSGTPLEGRKINNPDSENLAYIVLHGVPANRIDEVSAFLAPVRARRNRRNLAQVAALNDLLEGLSLEPISFDTDVAARSCVDEGGSITERHILYALSLQLLDRCGPGDSLIGFLKRRMRIDLPAAIEPRLRDAHNVHIAYDLLGVLKSAFLERFFIQPDFEECLPVADVVAFGNSIGAIPAYAYLGDVEESPTGDKKAERFEDAYLPELFACISELGFRSVTYMPPRNSVAQLRRVREFASLHGLLEISGVDINSSRQSFRCPEILSDDFRHLIDTTWALIAHEKLAACRADAGLFHPGNPLARLALRERVARYATIGKELDQHHPEEICGKELLI